MHPRARDSGDAVMANAAGTMGKLAHPGERPAGHTPGAAVGADDGEAILERTPQSLASTSCRSTLRPALHRATRLRSGVCEIGHPLHQPPAMSEDIAPQRRAVIRQTLRISLVHHVTLFKRPCQSAGATRHARRQVDGRRQQRLNRLSKRRSVLAAGEGRAAAAWPSVRLCRGERHCANLPRTDPIRTTRGAAAEHDLPESHSSRISAPA